MIVSRQLLRRCTVKRHDVAGLSIINP